MHDETYEPVDPGHARNQYGALFRKTGATDADKQAALATLVTANIDKKIRDTFHENRVPLDPAQVGYLVGLLLMQCGSGDGLTVERLERAVREAFYVTPTATAEDRERIAQMILDGGQE